MKRKPKHPKTPSLTAAYRKVQRRYGKTLMTPRTFLKLARGY